MAIHPFDYTIQTDLYSTPAYAALFDEKARIQRWLDVEAALALCQAERAVIPQPAGEAIAAAASLDRLDLDLIRDHYQRSRNSLIPVLRGLQKACGRYGQYVHYGATTQDILDCGEALAHKAALNLIYRHLGQLLDHLQTLTNRHRDTPMIGRSHGQQALPISFGLKTAGWLAELVRHHRRLTMLAPGIAMGQLGGAVGTMAALGPHGLEIASATMQRLGLGWQLPAWHSSRDRQLELACFLTNLITFFEKIANEIYQLSKTEIAELAEPAAAAKSSSTMPHKVNPVLCQRVVVMGRQTRALCGVVQESAIHEHERDPRGLWGEWLTLPQMIVYTGSALEYLNKILADLHVHREAMGRNLALHGDTCVSEWLVFQLAPRLGKTTAMELVAELLDRQRQTQKGLKILIRQDSRCASLFTDEELSLLDHPERYRGHHDIIIDTVLNDATRYRHSIAQELFA